MAGLLGFGGPKRLVLTLLAMASVSEATLGDVASLSLVAIYIGVATVLVWVPVGIVVIAGERAAVIIAQGHSWLTTPTRPSFGCGSPSESASHCAPTRSSGSSPESSRRATVTRMLRAILSHATSSISSARSSPATAGSGARSSRPRSRIARSSR